MICRIKGTCVFVAEPREVEFNGKKNTVKEFHFLVGGGPGVKAPPELVKATTFNGFAVKLNEMAEFDARVTLRERFDKRSNAKIAELSVTVL
jgi:hypothetical protein